VSPSTVNRSVIKPLQWLFSTAREDWGIRFDNEPKWRELLLAEPEEHVRELRQDEADAISLATRPDYAPFFNFARATGLRLRECFLKWNEVDWNTRKVVKKGKGGRTVITPITDEIEAILAPLLGHHPEWVFTYVADRTRGGLERGRRYPITYNGLKTAWRRIRIRAGVDSFRFHDFRHDLATKLLRATGNLKLVQKALNHSDIKTTTRYAHVVDDEVAAALESLQRSRNKSRNGLVQPGK
jgi:integrase